MSANNYSPDWNDRRKKVYRRDGYKCQNCSVLGGSKGNAELHAHHVVPKSKGGTHDTSNLISICKECHNAVHGNKNAPTRGSREDASSKHIQDIKSFITTFQQYSEQRDIMSGIGTIPTGELNRFSDYDVVQQSQEFIGEIKDARESLTKCQFKLENMDLNYEEMIKNAGSGDESELRSTIERLRDLTVGDIELLIQKANICQEYIELLGVAVCPNCGNKEDPEESFCGECGEELPEIWSCTNCGDSIESSGQKFCKSCGSEITTFPETQNTKLESMREEVNEIIEQLDNSVEDIDAAFMDLKNLAS